LLQGSIYSNASQLIGIEKNQFFANLQQDIAKKHFKDSSRIKVICDDIMNQSKKLEEADVIVLNNVFEFFTPGDKLEQMWQFLRKAIKKKGTKLVTIPSIKESLKRAKVSQNTFSSI
jgi:chemotaxis methyl-accepting protein methylase